MASRRVEILNAIAARLRRIRRENVMPKGLPPNEFHVLPTERAEWVAGDTLHLTRAMPAVAHAETLEIWTPASPTEREVPSWTPDTRYAYGEVVSLPADATKKYRCKVTHVSSSTPPSSTPDPVTGERELPQAESFFTRQPQHLSEPPGVQSWSPGSNYWQSTPAWVGKPMNTGLMQTWRNVDTATAPLISSLPDDAELIYEIPLDPWYKRDGTFLHQSERGRPESQPLDYYREYDVFRSFQLDADGTSVPVTDSHVSEELLHAAELDPNPSPGSPLLASDGNPIWDISNEVWTYRRSTRRDYSVERWVYAPTLAGQSELYDATMLGQTHVLRFSPTVLERNYALELLGQVPERYPLTIEYVSLRCERPDVLRDRGLLPALLLQYHSGAKMYEPGKWGRIGETTETLCIVIRAVLPGMKISSGRESSVPLVTEPLTVTIANLHESLEWALGDGTDLLPYPSDIGRGEVKTLRIPTWRSLDGWGLDYEIVDFRLEVVHTYPRGTGV